MRGAAICWHSRRMSASDGEIGAARVAVKGRARLFAALIELTRLYTFGQ
jgi:hypothetical protein